MKAALFAAMASALAFSAIAADVRENRPVSGFHAISVGAALDVDVVQDGTESLSMEGDADTLSRIETTVRDGTLEFRSRPGTRVIDRGRVHAVVHARNVDAVAISGAANVKSAGLEADSLKLSISGSGDMDIGRVAARQASLAISGSGTIEAAGRVEQLASAISGSGAIKAGMLESQGAAVKISGAGNATMWARRELSTAISGVGNVRYYGDPSLANSIRGVGNVQRVAANP